MTTGATLGPAARCSGGGSDGDGVEFRRNEPILVVYNLMKLALSSAPSGQPRPRRGRTRQWREVTAPDGAAEEALRGKYGWKYRGVLAIEQQVGRRPREQVVLRTTTW